MNRSRFQLLSALAGLGLLIPTAQIGGFFLGPVIASRFLTPGEGFGPANTMAIVCCTKRPTRILPRR